MASAPLLKPILWIASSLADIQSFPEDARSEAGYALFKAQQGKKHVSAKPLKGFGDAQVMEIVVSSDGDAFRAIYAVRFAGVICVLYAFQKKSKSGARTPAHEMEVVRRRLARAVDEYRLWSAKHGKKTNP